MVIDKIEKRNKEAQTIEYMTRLLAISNSIVQSQKQDRDSVQKIINATELQILELTQKLNENNKNVTSNLSDYEKSKRFVYTTNFTDIELKKLLTDYEKSLSKRNNDKQGNTVQSTKRKQTKR